jgi:hypothetical protein
MCEPCESNSSAKNSISQSVSQSGRRHTGQRVRSPSSIYKRNRMVSETVRQGFSSPAKKHFCWGCHRLRSAPYNKSQHSNQQSHRPSMRAGDMIDPSPGISALAQIVLLSLPLSQESLLSSLSLVFERYQSIDSSTPRRGILIGNVAQASTDKSTNLRYWL